MSRKLKPVSPGEMLAEEFLKPLGMSNYLLAKEIGVPAQRIGEIHVRVRGLRRANRIQLHPLVGGSLHAGPGVLQQRQRQARDRHLGRPCEVRDPGLPPELETGKMVSHNPVL